MGWEFLICASYASEAAPLLKACFERDARTACIFRATRRYRRWLPLESRDGERGATCGNGPTRERCESTANAGARSVRAGSQFWPREKSSRLRISTSGPRDASGSLLSSRPGSHLPHCTLPSLAPLPSSTFLYTSSGLPPSIRRPRALIRPLACASIEFTASSCLESTRQFGDKPCTVSYVSSTFYDRLRFFCIPH